MLPDAPYTLVIGGTPWQGWESMNVRRSIERMGGDFSFTLAGKPDEKFLGAALKPGLSAVVMLGETTVLDGYIDVVQHKYDDSSAQITLVGRDKTGDLIDCAATVEGPHEFRNIKLEKVLEKILKPYKIPLTVQADTGSKFKRIAIQPGETAFDFIERACRYRSVLPISDGIGGLVLVKPGKDRSPGQLTYGVNVKEGEATLDYTGRFSLYVLKGQVEGEDDFTAEETSWVEGRVEDELVTRYRPKVIVAETQGYSATLKERAAWEKAVARGRASTFTATVPTWYADQQFSQLWLPNTIVSVTDPARGLGRDLLLVGVEYARGPNGTTTTLELMLPEAFELPAESDPQFDDGEVWDA